MCIDCFVNVRTSKSAPPAVSGVRIAHLPNHGGNALYSRSDANAGSDVTCGPKKS